MLMGRMLVEKLLFEVLNSIHQRAIIEAIENTTPGYIYHNISLQ